mgnify:CR=1 FL=1
MAEQAEFSVCPKCRELERRVAALESQLSEALIRLAAATKNSGNSSKPPSSDIVKAAIAGRKKKGKKRKVGGQPGHPKAERKNNLYKLILVEILEDAMTCACKMPRSRHGFVASFV